MTFLKKKSSFKISQLSQKDFCKNSLCPHDYKELILNNKRIIKLSDLIETSYKGIEIGSYNYMKKSSYRFLKTVNITENMIYGENTIEYCKPFFGIKPINNDILIVKDGAGNGLGQVAIYKSRIDSEDYISAGLIGIRIQAKHKFYVLGFLKSQHFKDFINVNTAQGSTIRHAKLIALNYPVPFPTKNNNKKFENIEKYVSLLTQNIIDKEEQIEKKVNSINKEFEKGIFDVSNTIKYKYPTKNELLKAEKRLDTGIYKKKFKTVIENIKSYPKGFFKLESVPHKWTSGSTPSILIETNKKSDINWIAVADINYGLTYKRLKSFKLNDKINEIVDGDILITRKGATVGKMIIYFNTGFERVFVNEDLKVLNLKTNIANKIFIGLFLNCKYGQIQLLSNGSKGTKQGLTNPNILNTVIPNFDNTLKDKIAKYYYNPISINNGLTIDNYLEKETARNKKLGISNLNLECFELKIKLELIIDKIIKEEKIEIEL